MNSLIGLDKHRQGSPGKAQRKTNEVPFSRPGMCRNFPSSPMNSGQSKPGQFKNWHFLSVGEERDCPERQKRTFYRQSSPFPFLQEQFQPPGTRLEGWRLSRGKTRGEGAATPAKEQIFIFVLRLCNNPVSSSTEESSKPPVRFEPERGSAGFMDTARINWECLDAEVWKMDDVNSRIK